MRVIGAEYIPTRSDNTAKRRIIICMKHKLIITHRKTIAGYHLAFSRITWGTYGNSLHVWTRRKKRAVLCQDRNVTVDWELKITFSTQIRCCLYIFVFPIGFQLLLKVEGETFTWTNLVSIWRPVIWQTAVPPPPRFTFDVMSIAGGPRRLAADIGCCFLLSLFRVDDCWIGPVRLLSFQSTFPFLCGRVWFSPAFASNKSGAPHAVNEPNVWHHHCSILLLLLLILLYPYDLWLYLRPPTEWREKRETIFYQMVSTISDHVCDRQHWRRNLHKFP